MMNYKLKNKKYQILKANQKIKTIVKNKFMFIFK